MKTVTEHIRESLLNNVGYSNKPKKPSMEELEQTEWSDRFERLMRNRLIMGALRYDCLKASQPSYDNVGSMIKRLQKYKETGNTEFLVDVANLCLVEFEIGTHPTKHFKAIDDGEHKEESC